MIAATEVRLMVFWSTREEVLRTLANGTDATVLVGGQYINGGLHLTRPENRKPFDPKQHGRCERATP